MIKMQNNHATAILGYYVPIQKSIMMITFSVRVQKYNLMENHILAKNPFCHLKLTSKAFSKV